MATKSKGFPKVNFRLDGMPGCCGIGVACDFQEEGDGYYDWFSSNVIPSKKPYATKKQQARAVYERILEQSSHPDSYYTQLLISLVSSYADGRKPQFPALEELLLEEGWTIYSVFINPNHGNEVTLYGKYFPERHKTIEEMDEMWEEYDNF